MYFNNATFLVAGLQKSGFSVSKHLLSKNSKVYLYDKRKTPDILKNVEELTLLGGIFIEDYENLNFEIDVLVISPGVPIDSEICRHFKSKGVRIIGELELGCLEIKKPIIAITGTNGKTTVSTLIDSAINTSNLKSVLCGNVGTPITSQIQKINNSDICVLEVSSYQLETTYLFCPHISVILNVTPDHLNRHYTFENYVLVKSKILLPLRESEFAVLNYDDENVRKLARLTKAKIVWFSLKERVNGAYLADDAIYFKDEKIIEVKDVIINEEHNLSNVLATISVLKSLKIKNEDIVKSNNFYKR